MPAEWKGLDKSKLTVLLMDLGRVSSRTGPWSSSTSPNSKDTKRGSLKSGRGWDRGMRTRTWRKTETNVSKQKKQASIIVLIYSKPNIKLTESFLDVESCTVTDIRSTCAEQQGVMASTCLFSACTHICIFWAPNSNNSIFEHPTPTSVRLLSMCNPLCSTSSGVRFWRNDETMSAWHRVADESFYFLWDRTQWFKVCLESKHSPRPLLI